MALPFEAQHGTLRRMLCATISETGCPLEDCLIGCIKVNGPVSGRLTSSGTPPGKSAKSQNFARKKPLGGVRPKKINTKPAFGPKKEIQTLKQQGKGRLTAVGPGDQNGKNAKKRAKSFSTSKKNTETLKNHVSGGLWCWQCLRDTPGMVFPDFQPLGGRQ